MSGHDHQEEILGNLLWIPNALLYIPLGVLIAVIALEIGGGVMRSREMQRPVLILLVLALVSALMATHIGFFLSLYFNQGPNFPFRGLLWGYALGSVLILAWVFKFRATRAATRLSQLTASHRSKHRTAGLRFQEGLYRLFFMASLILLGVCLRFQTSFTGSATVIALQLGPGDTPAPAIAATTPPASSAAGPAPAPGSRPAPPAPDKLSPVAPMTGVEPVATVSVPAPPPAPATRPPAQPAAAAPAPVAAAVDPESFFATRVRPILEDRCYECHGETKDKGDLRLHTPNAIRTGGKDGVAVEAGDPGASPLYTRTTLPPDDDDIMPSKGDPLTPQQQEILKKWIAEGADLGDGREFTDMGPAPDATMAANQAPVLSTDVVTPDPAFLENLTKKKIGVKPASDDGIFLEIDYSGANIGAGELDLKQLFPIARNIVSLDLSKTRVADADIAPVAEFTNLVRLKLDRTNTGDEALSHVGDLEKLEYIGLFGTRISDYGLYNLENLKNLKEVFVVNTPVTPDGIKRLQKSLPDAEILGPE